MGKQYLDLAEAFVIFNVQYPDPKTQNTSAEHDVIYAGGPPGDVPKDVVDTLRELGWIPDSEYDCWKYFT